MSAVSLGWNLLYAAAGFIILGFSVWVYTLCYNGSFGSSTFNRRKLSFWQGLALLLTLGISASWVVLMATFTYRAFDKKAIKGYHYFERCEHHNKIYPDV